LGGKLILLDVDLADLLGVPVECLVELILQSKPTIPGEFAFFLEPNDIQSLVPRIRASHWSSGRARILAVTEHGAIMAASMLKSVRATEISIAIVRVFVKLREDDGLLALMAPGTPSPRELH
jgi:hypothetical protein